MLRRWPFESRDENMTQPNKDFRPTRRPSRIAEIWPNMAERHPSGEIDVTDLPFSAQRAFESVQGKIVDKAKLKNPEISAESIPPSPYAIITAFLSMECCFPWQGKVEDCNRALCHLLRVKEGSQVDAPGAFADDKAGGAFILAMDSLLQLARIPDILTSPICMNVFSKAEAIRAHRFFRVGKMTSPSDAEVKLIEEACHFHSAFFEDQLAAEEDGRRQASEAKEARISLALTAFLKSPTNWHTDAEDKIRRFSEARNDISFIPPNDMAREFRRFKGVLEYYERMLRLPLRAEGKR